MRSKKAIYNVCTNIMLQLLIIINGFIIPKIIISSFGSNVNGLVSSITQFLAYITLLESGFGPVVKSLLYKPIALNEKSEIENIIKTSERFFRNLAFIFLIYILFLCLVYPQLVNKDFDSFFTASLIVIIGISTFAEYFFGITYKLFLQANQKNYIINIIQIITYIISIFVIVVLAKCGASIHTIKLVSGLLFIIRPISQNLYVKKKFKLDLKNAKKNYEIKQKWDGLSQHIAYVIHTNTDVTVLTIFASLIEVSIYSVYALVVRGVKSIIGAFTSGIDAAFGDMIAKNEKENLNKKYGIYEVLYNTVSTIAYTSAIVLIVPFISVYTKNVIDANYIKYSFGALIVISEFIWAIRQPYNVIILAAGHFKETRVGAWIECITNIVLSIILVRKYGLIGVTIGTIVAMTIRTIEFVYHTNKYILERPIKESVKKILLVVMETLIIIILCDYLPYVNNTNYIKWIINAIMVFTTASTITLLFNYYFFKKEFLEVIKIFKGVLKRKKNA